MINDFIAWFQAQLGTEIFGGVAAVSVLGYLAYTVRALPNRLWFMVKKQIVSEVTVRSDDNMFRIVAAWLAYQPFMQRTRRVKLITKKSRYDTDDEEDENPYLMIPAPGIHWLFHKGWPVILHIDDGQDGKTTSSVIVIESITLTTLGRRPTIVKDILAEAFKQKQKERKVLIWSHSNRAEWNSATAKIPRPLSSVVTKENAGESVLKDIQTFFDQREWYVSRGIPWRRGYMLVGPPGTGKSSLVFAIASELRLPIYCVALGAHMEDSALMELLASVAEKGILLIEDIDTFPMTQSRELEQAKSGTDRTVTLSGLLNAMDGVAAADGRILIMTTNFPDKLDKALVRPGRVDKVIHIENFTKEESLKMWRLFFGNDPNEQMFLDRVPDLVQPAALQNHFALYRDSARVAAERVSILHRVGESHLKVVGREDDLV